MSSSKRQVDLINIEIKKEKIYRESEKIIFGLEKVRNNYILLSFNVPLLNL